MALSFTRRIQVPVQAPQHRAVLVAGAAGHIGSYFAEHSHQHYHLTLMVHQPEHGEPIKRFGKVVAADIAPE